MSDRTAAVDVPPASPTAPPHPVLHIAAPAPVGGLERVVQGLAVGQHARGWTVHVAAAVASSDHPFLKPLRDAGVPLHLLLEERPGLLEERRRVRTILDELQPSVVHTHGYRPDLLDAPLARKRRIATVTTEHGSSRMGGKAALYEWVQSRKRRSFDAVIAVSSAIAARLEDEEGVPRDRVHLIPNCWSSAVEFLSPEAARDRLQLPRNGPAVGWVGRMIRAKGPDIMAEAIRHMGPAASVVFVGDGPLKGAVERILGRDGTRSRVRLAGHLDNAAPVFRAFDVFALSSRTEGTPIVVLEAMAAGVPIVAPRVGGVTDMLSPVEAVLVPAADPRALGRAIADAVSNPDDMRERAARAKERLLRDFGADLWLDRHEAAYRQAVRLADEGHERYGSTRSRPRPQRPDPRRLHR